MLLNPSEAKKSELIAELDLYSRAGVEFEALPGNATNKARAELIEKLGAEHGYPVELTPEFIAENEVLAKYLLENGAQEGEIVFAEDADMEEVEKLLEAQNGADDDAEAGDGSDDENDDSNDEEASDEPAEVEENDEEAQPDLVYQNKTVVSVTDVLVGGRAMKDVHVVSGETFRLSFEEFDRDVRER